MAPATAANPISNHDLSPGDHTMNDRKLASILALTFVTAAPAVAADKTVDVRFDPGKQSKEIQSSITGEAGVNYMLAVRQGQAMQVLFAPKKGSCYFNAWEPGRTDGAVHIGSSAGNEFGANPTQAGTYRVQVYQMRATARRNETCSYSISFEVTGAGTAAAAKTAAAPSEVAKGACLFKMGTEASIVGTSALKPGFWEIVLQAKSGGKRVACTVSDAGDIQEWTPMR
jgi:hypothetical protein